MTTRNTSIAAAVKLIRLISDTILRQQLLDNKVRAWWLDNVQDLYVYADWIVRSKQLNDWKNAHLYGLHLVQPAAWEPRPVGGANWSGRRLDTRHCVHVAHC